MARVYIAYCSCYVFIDDISSHQISELRAGYLAKAVSYLHTTEEALAPAQVEVGQAQTQV